MGNISCMPHDAAETAKVVTCSGTAYEFLHPVRAEELVRENPGQFVCDSSNLQVGCRVPGLASDQELQRQRLYFLLPLDLLFSVLTEEEMACLRSRAARTKRQRTPKRKKSDGRKKRIFPMFGDFCLSPPVANGSEMKEEKKDCKAMVCGDAGWKQRSWKPALDTIEEEEVSFVDWVAPPMDFEFGFPYFTISIDL
ncbi:hypothetical protein HPP92_004456 [Vanilla planifolia]|uniref:Uncharacterized protein n=1 Tax=Vanilla planifolia TaxID=51239 RepID=A0A835V8J3_VANPL|nr:hypothetical protein HPP92_004882 [Vanilla planifolia]KAG0493462.1 hypothetical protein HPP92_004456 [Vanilla planifolia]